MCGIAGIFSYNKALDENIIRKMTETLEHRGPDAQGYFQNNKNTCFLGHRRLSIIDLNENANQPMQIGAEGYTIVYNGEIYNYKEIRSELKSKFNVSFTTNSDTEVILQAFIVWGGDFIN